MDDKIVVGEKNALATYEDEIMDGVNPWDIIFD